MSGRREELGNHRCGVCEKRDDGTLRRVREWNAQACARCRLVGLYPTPGGAPTKLGGEINDRSRG